MNDQWLADARDDVQERVWRDLLVKHARPDGVEGDECAPSGGLAIFDDEEAGRAAVADLHEEGSPLLSVVPCEHGEHWHLRVGA